MQREEKEVLEELMNQPFIHNEEHTNELLVEELLVAMSQINLREEEIKEFKEENQELKQDLARNTEEKNKVLNENKRLQKKFNELKDKITGKLTLQGGKTSYMGPIINENYKIQALFKLC